MQPLQPFFWECGTKKSLGTRAEENALNQFEPIYGGKGSAVIWAQTYMWIWGYVYITN